MGPIDRAANLWKRVQAVYLLVSNNYLLVHLERHFGPADTYEGCCIECTYKAGLIRLKLTDKDEHNTPELKDALSSRIQDAIMFLKEEGYGK